MQSTGDVRNTLLSLGLSCMLDNLGYSSQIIDLRRRHCRNYEYIHHIQFQSDSLLVPRKVGSKGEGLSQLFESDHDYLFICKYVVCIEASVFNYTSSLPKINTVYTMVPCGYHPGHFKLMLTREGLPSMVTEIMCTFLNPSDSGHWLSSKEFLGNVKSVHKEADTTAGPAVSVSKRPGHYSEDRTFTLPCICPNILGKWIQRDRKYNWPPREVIQQISQMGGNLVATGIKGCNEEEIEWRLCFNEIEILIVENWNDTETKLYLVLKMIKKDILKLDHEITSYMMKNILFWLSETYPQTDFRPDSLFSWVIKALRLLKRAIKGFHLPYYMIPERNLIAEKLPKYRIKKAIKQINNAIKLGPQLLWKCKKIEMAMTMSLPELQLYQRKRDELEWLLLLQAQDRKLKCGHLGLTLSDWIKTDGFKTINMRLVELLYSPWPSVVQQQLSKCSTSLELIEELMK